MKVAVVGHVEWCRFIKLEHTPKAGEIVHASKTWYEAAGGGGVAAAELVRLAGNCLFFTAVGIDEAGRKAIEQLKGLGIEVYASISETESTQESVVALDKNHERTITVIGGIEPSGQDKTLPWDKLKEVDVVYFVSGDVSALHKAREAAKLVSTTRILPILREAHIDLEVLVLSSKDSEESFRPGDLIPQPKLVVITDGKNGGKTSNGLIYEAELVPESQEQDSYGCGDSFAAGLTYGIGSNLDTQGLLKLAAHSGANAIKRSGAHGLN